MYQLVQVLKEENKRRLVHEYGKYYIYVHKKDNCYFGGKINISSDLAQDIIDGETTIEQVVRERLNWITYKECLYKLTIEGTFDDLIIFHKYHVYYHEDFSEWCRDEVSVFTDFEDWTEIYVIKDKNAYSVKVNVVDDISDDEAKQYDYCISLNEFVCLITLNKIDSIKDFDLKTYFKQKKYKHDYKSTHEIKQLINKKDLLHKKISKCKNQKLTDTDNYKKLCGLDKNLDEKLSQYRVKPFRNQGHDFNKNRQTVIDTIPTNDFRMDGKIAFRCGYGFERDLNKKCIVIRKEQVKLFKYKSSEQYIDCSYMALINRSPLGCCIFEWSASVPFIVIDNGVKKLACIRDKHTWSSDTKSDIYLIDANNVLEIIKTNTYYRHFKNSNKKISIEEYCDLLHERFNSESSECLDLLKYIADSSCVDSDYKNCIDYLKARKFQFEPHDIDLKNWPVDIGLLIKNETENLRKQIKRQDLFSSLPFVISNDKDLAWFVCSFYNDGEYTYDQVFIQYIYVMDKYGRIKRTKVWFEYNYNNNLDNTPLIETDQEYLELLQLELENFSKDSMLHLIEKAEGNTLLPVYKVIMSNLIGQLSLEMQSQD